MQGSFSLGSVLGRGFSITLKNPAFLLIGLVLNIPVLFMSWSMVHQAMNGELTTNGVYKMTIGIGILGRLIWILLSAILINGVFQQLRGQPVSIGATVRAGLNRLFPTIGVTLVTGVILIFGALLIFIHWLLALIWVFVMLTG